MPQLNSRHCERSDLSAEAFGEGGSNPESLCGKTLDCFVAALLAMTAERVSLGCPLAYSPSDGSSQTRLR
jgi:hypothetical protein